MNSLRPRGPGARQRGCGERSGAGRTRSGQAQEDGKLLPHKWSQTSLLPAPTLSYSRVMGWGWGGAGFILKAVPELGGGQRASSGLSLCLSQVSRESESVGTSGPLPHFQGRRPPEFPGHPWDLQDGRWGVGSSMRFLDTGPRSLPPAGRPGIGDSPHPSLAARPQGGMRHGCSSRITGLALGISPGPGSGRQGPKAPAASACSPKETLSRAGQAWTLGCHGDWFYSPCRQATLSCHPALPGLEGGPRARGTADCGGLGLGARKGAHVAFSNELRV